MFFKGVLLFEMHTKMLKGEMITRICFNIIQLSADQRGQGAMSLIVLKKGDGNHNGSNISSSEYV